MAPVTRHEATNGTKFNHNKVMRRSKDSSDNLRLVRCTVHLDQIQKSGEIKTMPKMRETSFVQPTGRLVHPLIFKPFSPEMLNENSSDGNVSFILDLESLATRFERCVFLNKNYKGCMEMMMTRRTRDIARYSTNVAIVYDERDDIEHRIAAIQYLVNLAGSKATKFYIDVLPTDFRFFKKRWVREFVNHEKCSEHGDSCANLMSRGVSWDAINFK